VNSILGPLVLGVVSYPITDTVENQLIGLELVTVFLVVPWATIAALAARRGHPAAPLLGFAPSAYTAYMFVQYVLGPEYSRYSVTALSQVAICALAGGTMLWSWSLARRVPLVPISRPSALHSGVLLLALAAFVLLRYAGAFVGSFRGSAIENEFAQERTFFWSIFLLDLGIVVPCTVAAALSLMHGTAAGHRALYAVVGWFALVPPSVAAMAAVMWARNDPNASVPTVLILSAASLVFGAIAWRTFQPLLRGPDRAQNPERKVR
jgi:hypothetical protein